MRIEEWLQFHVDSKIKHTSTPDEVHVCCPICKENRYRLYINLSSGLAYCHNCQFKGTIIKLVQLVEGITYYEAKQQFKEIDRLLPEMDLRDYLMSKSLYAQQYTVQKRSIKLPEEYCPLVGNHTALATQATNYLHKRGITNEQIAFHQMGICAEGEYAKRIIIPIYQGEELRFWIARSIASLVYPKEKSPHTEFYQYSKSEVLFNLNQAAKAYNSIILSEGIFDALSWGDIGVALLGKILYESQLVTLLQYQNYLTEGIYVALDSDAIRDAIKVCEQLAQYFKVYLVIMPAKYDDPNNYLVTHSKRALWELLQSAIPFEEFTGLKIKLLL